MYKYFSVLDNPDDYKVYLKRRILEEKREVYFDRPLSDEFYDKDLFERINTIKMLIEGSNEKLFWINSKKLSYQELDTIVHFFEMKDEQYVWLQRDFNKINWSTRDLECTLIDIIRFCYPLKTMFPEMKEYISETIEIINKKIKELEEKIKIKLPDAKQGVEYTFPNAWYITPNGYLYNTGTGHKEGNLIYPLYYNIFEQLKNNENVEKINLFGHIEEILDRGYVTQNEFYNYGHLIYDVPTILTPEVEYDIERFNNLIGLDEKEIEKRVKGGWPHPERTYQQKIITLVIGYLAAKTALYESFSKLNDSYRKKELAQVLYQLDFDDILVRFCGFHKISSICDKTITTSQIRSIELFKEYLDRGYTLDIIPGIIYDKQKDDLIEMDFNWYHIDKYLDSIMAENDNYSKIKIKK